MPDAEPNKYDDSAPTPASLTTERLSYLLTLWRHYLEDQEKNTHKVLPGQLQFDLSDIPTGRRNDA